MKFRIVNGEIVTIGLNNGDAFPESEVSPVLERVRDVKLLSPNATMPAEKLRVAGKQIQGEVQVPKDRSFVLIARTVPNLLVLPAKEFHAYLKEEGLESVIAWRQKNGVAEAQGRERYAKFAKSLLTAGGPNDFHTRPAGLEIEIVPEKSPYDVKAGEPWKVTVLFLGQPLAGTQIESAWAGADGAKQTTIVGRTDEQGQITIPLGAAGRWRIHTVRMARCTDQGTADWESYWASLTFELK
ncbi:MAG: DUF4198 domain-containing protein [Candidatus Acidiferrum sp.]